MFKKGDKSYYGRDGHQFADKLLGSGSEVLVVSPYLDSYYANKIKGRGGTKFYIISSSMDKQAEKMLDTGRSVGFAIAFTLVLIGVNLLLYLTHQLSIIFLLLSIAAIVISFAYSFRKKARHIWIKKPRGFVHAKMYVSDVMGIEGSANLTYSGMHKNVEHLQVTYDDAKIEKMKDEFWKMWDTF